MGSVEITRWFDLTAAEKKAIKESIKAVTRKDIEIDIEGLREMFKAFLDIQRG